MGRKSKITKELETLNTTDAYSLVLFALYQLKNIPEYSTLSELIYILDKKNFMNLLEYFGGLTIKIPTIEELEFIVNCLLLYNYVNIENIEFDTAVQLLDKPEYKLAEIKSTYAKLCEILNKFSFKRSD